MQHATPGRRGVFVLGLSDLSAPFRGGTLVPFPDVLVPLLVDEQGESLLSATWPAGVSAGSQFWSQVWFVQGEAASTRAVLATTP